MERRCRVGGVAFSSAAGGAAAAPRPRPPLNKGDDDLGSMSAAAAAAAVLATAATAAVSVEVVKVSAGFLCADCGERLTLKVSLEVSERFCGALPPPLPPPPRPPPPLPLPLPLPLPASTSIFCQPKVPSIVMSPSFSWSAAMVAVAGAGLVRTRTLSSLSTSAWKAEETRSSAVAAPSETFWSIELIATPVSGVSERISPKAMERAIGEEPSLKEASTSRLRALISSESSSFIKNLVMRPMATLKLSSWMMISGRRATGIRSSESSARAGSTMLASSGRPLAA
eukprot:scaffold6499_cov62-Phaeocystis_antarctica.AAC.2